MRDKATNDVYVEGRLKSECEMLFRFQVCRGECISSTGEVGLCTVESSDCGIDKKA